MTNDCEIFGGVVEFPEVELLHFFILGMKKPPKKEAFQTLRTRAAGVESSFNVKWWVWSDLNTRPPRYERGALTN